MANKINTNTLMKRLFKANDLDAYMKGNESQFGSPDFQAMLKDFCEKRGLLPARVIEQSQIERTYGHQLFNGTRRPSRMGLNVEETQKLLRAAGKSPLYPRLRRDAVILFGIRKSFSILDVQEALAKYRLTTLGGQRDGGE